MNEMVKTLSDKGLMETFDNAKRQERQAIGLSLTCLIEITERDLPARLGYSSLFSFLTRHQKLSESSASKRLAALGLVRRFPDVLALIESGEIHLSNLSLVAKLVTNENKVSLLGAASRMTHRELEAHVASLTDRVTPMREVVKAVALTPVTSRPATPKVAAPAEPRTLFAPPSSLSARASEQHTPKVEPETGCPCLGLS
jgi:hypothetical protein